MLRPAWPLLTAMAFTFFSVSGSGPALAQAPLAPPAQGQPAKQVLFDLEALLARTLAPGLHQDSFQHQIKLPFDMHDIDRDGAITDADRQRNRQRFEAANRAEQVSQMLQADLNSDGIITADEMAIFARYLSRFSSGDGAEADARRVEQARRIVESRMKADSNGDGRIDWGETFAYARKFPTPSPIDFDAPYRALLSFDTDRDGKTTFEEYSDAMQRRFTEVDSDGNGLISRAEFDAYWQQSGKEAPKVAEIQPTLEQKSAVECAVPKPAKDVKFVLFNGYHPAALSTAAIGSQDRETLTTRVIIEPGAEPLYLVMIAWNRLIWQFEGAVGRVKRVILAQAGAVEPEGPSVGATGLPKEIVTIPMSEQCRRLWMGMEQKNNKNPQPSARLLFGREADVMVSADEMWNLKLPSGAVSEPSQVDQSQVFPNGDRGVRSTLLHYHPGGLMRIDAAAVIAGQPVTNYEVLPQQAGLLQLLADGALVRNQGGDFVVTRQTRLPGGLQGAHAHNVRFVVPKGVPHPSGSPGHSKVITE